MSLKMRMASLFTAEMDKFTKTLGANGNKCGNNTDGGMKKNIKLNWGRLCRRGTAFALALAMLLPTVAYGASAPLSAPAQVKVDSEFPNIEIQTNFVRSEYGTLEGTMELALRVGPSGKREVADPDDPDKTVEEPVPVGFRTLSVNLKYDTTLYTPVSWSWAGGADTAADLDLSADKYYSVDLPAKKNDTLPATGAIAKCGVIPADPDAGTEAKGEGLVYFKAEAYNSDITLTEMTTLAVIRFKINEPLASKISILPDGEGGYTVFVEDTTDTPMVVTNVDELHTALGRDLTKDPATVEFASEDDIYDTRPPVNMALHYTGANGQQMYYVPNYSTIDSVTVTIDGKDVDLDAPRTKNGRVLAVDKDATNKYSYMSNHFDDHPADGEGGAAHRHITWPVVSDVSFAFVEVDLSKYTTIVYVDWDNTLLGTQIVPKRADVREMVSNYVAEHFIYHDNSESLVPTTLVQVSSLTRAASYRGKYPTTPQPLNPDGTTTDPDNTVRLDGGNYALTNKLDYVFFKRPMEYDGETGTWTQKSDESGAAQWDAKTPFAYGWAKCTQANYKDTWTTLGVGELFSYSGAADGGYNALGTTPATVTYNGSGSFEFADLEKGFASTDDTVFLKAVYEPGEVLYPSSAQYRMIESPYYNKLNGNAANNGGAYSVDMAYERSNSEIDGTVRGVARVRDIMIRQDSTTDLYWESANLSGALSNASKDEADRTKTKTAYVPVNTDNGERVAFSLTLSARFNRIDYYLVENYNSNFVAGGQRSAGNKVKFPTKDEMGKYDYSEYIIENYNYNTNDSITDDEYYDVLHYNEREGSFGFVLTGTLNNLMKYATLNNASYNTYVNYSSIWDANIRNADGSTVIAGNQAALRTTFRNLAAAAATHRGDPDYWNNDPDKDWAELSYHQIQLYIITGNLYDRTTADGIPIQWCNLHAECANSRTGKPTNWAEVIAAAGEAGAPKLDAFSSLTELESLTYLRKDNTGARFDSLGDLKDALVAAVAAGCTTWDQVQDYIIRNGVQSDAETHSKANYWWYDGSTSSDIANWSGLLAAGKAAIADSSAPMAPGETVPANRMAKLNMLKAAYDANKDTFDAEEYSTDANWVVATENLAMTTEGGKEGYPFDSFADFVKAFVGNSTTDGALKKAINVGYNNPSWHQIQYIILNPTNSVPLPNGAGAPADYADYWWHNGATKITDLKTMLKAADSETAAWDNFTFADMQALTATTNAVADFRFSFAGTAFTEDDFDTFKARIKTYVASDSSWADVTNINALWGRVQYTLIHGNYTASDVSIEADFYWWKNGGSAQPVSIATMNGTSATTDADSLAKILVEAAFREKYNGNTEAYNDVTEGSDSILEQGRLVNEINNTAEGAAYPDDFTPASLSAVKAATEALINGMTVKDYIDYLNTTNDNEGWGSVWTQLQAALLVANSCSYTGDYWWKSKDELGADPAATWADLLGKIGSYLTDDGTVTESDLGDYFTVEMAVALEMTADGGGTFDDYGIEDFSDFPWSFIKSEGYTTLTWYQIQNMFIKHYCEEEDWTDSLQDPDESKSYVVDEYGIAPPRWLPTESALLTMKAPMMKAPALVKPEVKIETSEDGLTETTTTTTRSWNEETGSEDVEVVTTVVTKVIGEETTTIITVTTTMTTTIDPETWAPVTKTNTTTTREVVENEATAETEEPTEGQEPAEGEEPTEGKESGEEAELPDPEAPLESEPTESAEPAETTDPDNTDDNGNTQDAEESPSPEPTAEPTQNPGVSSMPEVVDPDTLESVEPEPTEPITPEPSPEPEDDPAERGGGTEDETPTPTEATETDDPEPEAPTEGPNIVSTLASLQKRSYRVSTRRLKAPPILRSPNIQRVTTRTVINRFYVRMRELILTYGRTPK